MNEDDARRIVNAIFDELGGRGGIGDQLDLIHDDTEVYNEMHHECVQRVIKADASSATPKSSRWDPEHV